MLLHEKMRLQRKQNKLTLKQLRNGNMLSRMESKIKRREKYYSKLEKQIDTQATVYKNQMQMSINQQFGVGQYNNMYGASGMNSIFTCPALAANMPQFAGDPVLLNYVMQYGNSAFTKNSSGTFDATYDQTITGIDQSAISEAVNYSTMMRQAQTQASAAAQNLKTVYEQQIEDWRTHQKEELEMQQEWEMDLLAEQQADYEAEKEGIAAELELVKQRKEAIEQELGQSIKDAAPKFGLA